jgi:hypothetical protein
MKKEDVGKNKLKSKKSLLGTVAQKILYLIIGAFLTVLGLIFYHLWESNLSFNMEIIGSYQTFDMPFSFFKSNEDYKKMSDYSELEKKFPDLENVKQNDGSGVVYSLSSYFKEATLSAQINKFELYDSLWTFEIHNKGKSKINNLVLNIPFGGFYEVSDIDKKLISNGFLNGSRANKINIESMSPDDKINIKIWSNRTAYYSLFMNKISFYDDDPKLVFDGGVVKAKFK